MKWLLILLAILAILIAAIVIRVNLQIRQAESDFPPEGQFINVSGRQVHYVEKGVGQPLILIHGASGSSRDFTFRLVEKLSTDFRVIAFDRPGLGYTDRVRSELSNPFNTDAESPEEQAQLLISAAQKLGIEDPLVVGQSFGGAVALAWALEDTNTKGLVLISAVSQPWPGDLGTYYQSTSGPVGGAIIPYLIAAIATRKMVNNAIEGVFAPQPAPAGYDDHIGAALSVRPASFRANSRQVNGLRDHIVTMAPKYHTLDLPVEMIHGDADTTVPLDIHSIPTASTIKGANLVILDGIGHMPHHSAEEEVIAAIQRTAARAGLR